MATFGNHSTAPIRVAVGEDNPVFAEGLRAIFDGSPDLDVVGTAADRDSLIALALRKDIDVVVTDLRMPPTGSDEGLQVAQHLRTVRPSVAVIVLSQFVDPSVALALLSDGEERRGYLLKDRVGRPRDLVEAVRTVHSGGTVIDPAVVTAAIGRDDGASGPLEALSPRELDVLRLVAEGLGNEGIAERLSIGRAAVEKHLTSIFAKLPMGEAPTVNRRVTATLLYLSTRGPRA